MPARHAVLASLLFLFPVLPSLANNTIVKVRNDSTQLHVLSDLKVFGAGGQQLELLKPNHTNDDIPMGSNQENVFFSSFRVQSYYMSYMDGTSEPEAKVINLTVCQGRPVAIATTFPTPSQGMVLVIDVSVPLQPYPPEGSVLNVVGGTVLDSSSQAIPGWFAGTSINLNTGVVTGQYTGPIIVKGYWNVAVCTTFFASYCTPGTSSAGCLPYMHATGIPQAGQTSGFTLACTQVAGQKAGLLFYGISGRGLSPWGNSTLCVKSPTQRMTVQNSGGSAGLCDGSLSIDWLAFMAANPNALGQPIIVGSLFNAQTWYRDPPATKTTNLSDALEFVLMP